MIFQSSRRDFLKTTIFGGAALVTAPFSITRLAAAPATRALSSSQVALTTGEDRADLAFKGLKQFEKQISKAIGSKRVIIKPNNVAIDRALCASHAQNLEGILEFLKSIGKRDVAIAESSAQGNTMPGFDGMGYLNLTRRYPVKLMDLNQEGFANVHIWKYGSISLPNGSPR